MPLFPQHWRPHRGRVWLLLAALLVLAAAAVGAYFIAAPYYHLHAAELALRKYDFDAAQTHLDACVKSWPDSADVRLLAARTARRRGAYDEAERQLAACDGLKGAEAAVARERALLRAQQGDLAEVETPLRDWVAQNDPDSPLILEALARGYFLDNRTDLAVDSLDKLLELRPDHFPALLLRGRVLESLRDDDEAVADYERAIVVNPFSTEARLRYAETLGRLGRTREAVGQYECLLRRPPTPPEATVGLARCRYDLDETPEASRLLDGLLAEHPDYVPGLVERGRLALRASRPGDAERDLRRGLEREPFNRDALLVLGRCLEDEGKDDEARQVQARRGRVEADLMRITNLKAKAADYPHDPAPRREIGLLYLGLGEDNQGLRWLSSALDEDPRDRPTHAALADYFERVGKKDEAAFHRRQADHPGGAP